MLNLLPEGRTTLEGSSSKYAGLAQNDADKNAPMRIPKGVPVNKRIIAFDSYDVSICVNPSIAIGTAAIAAIASIASNLRLFL